MTSIWSKKRASLGEAILRVARHRRGKQGALDWERADRIVDETNKRGIKLLVRVGMDPDRPFWAGDPPDNTSISRISSRKYAARYRGRIHAYQIWNEPNLAREWGSKRPDPAAYARMLRGAYSAIKAADPNAIVVTAGMAPTTEDSNRAMPDLRFYQGMYDAMGGKSDGYFDMLGVHGAGYAVSPETDPQVVATNPKLHNNDPSPAELKRVYAFRRSRGCRELDGAQRGRQQARRHLGVRLDDRQPARLTATTGTGGAGIDQAKQGCYLVRRAEYAKEKWQPWIGLMNMIYLPDVQWTKKDEQYYWSIIGPGYPDLFIRTAYVMVKNYLTKGVIQDYCFQYQ